MLARRHLLQLGLAGLLLPRPARAAGSTRRFLFVYASGGWDTTVALSPMFHNPAIDSPERSEEAEVEGIVFADGEDRPSVRAFFEAWGARTALLHGFEVRSIAHDKARQLLLTGVGTGGEDWGTVIASGGGALAMPFLVASGPTYTTRLGRYVVRLGGADQFAGLLDGTALPDGGLPRAAGDRVDAWLAARAAALGAARRTSGGFDLAYAENLARVGAVRARADELAFGGSGGVADQAETILTAFELGMTRTAILQHDGYNGVGWDSHGDNAVQSPCFELLFADLLDILDALATRPAPEGGVLLDDTTVVVLSEMGRHPKLNGFAGKDHWTYTSALFIGAGVRGGQTLGGYDESFLGRPVDLASGAPTDAGTPLTSGNVGATVLALADVDPGAWTDGAPIAAVLE